MDRVATDVHINSNVLEGKAQAKRHKQYCCTCGDLSDDVSSNSVNNGFCSDLPLSHSADFSTDTLP